MPPVSAALFSKAMKRLPHAGMPHPCYRQFTIEMCRYVWHKNDLPELSKKEILMCFSMRKNILLRRCLHGHIIADSSNCSSSCILVRSKLNISLPQLLPESGTNEYRSRVVGNLQRPPKTCHSSSESWENGDSEYVIRYAGKIRPFLNFHICITSGTIFFLGGFEASPQSANAKYLVRTCSQHTGEQSCCSKY